MSLNKLLHEKLTAIENQYGYQPDNWPEQELVEVQALADRFSESRVYTNAWNKQYLKSLMERGFFISTIAHKMKRSRTWVTMRAIDEVEWTMTTADRDELKQYLNDGWSVNKISRKMQRDVLWVREMKERV
ncbi:hypothetical protein ACUIJQ_08340 [Levilactobacillus hammesii]|uniref:hypothetical protein n=1 Tax=Levilactobacillus hammesii TaxID=267633 RepID=UPI00070C5BE4|nr:hypothetical protein [Levilactobacillus hammesii]